MRTTSMGCWIALMALATSNASAQSLAALAAQEAARRATLTESSPTYTNLDLTFWPAPTPPVFPPMPFVPALERTPPQDTQILATAQEAASAFESAAPTMVAPWWILASGPGHWRQNQWSRRQRASSSRSPFDVPEARLTGPRQGGDWPWMSQERRPVPRTPRPMDLDPFSSREREARVGTRSAGGGTVATPFPLR